MGVTGGLFPAKLLLRRGPRLKLFLGDFAAMPAFVMLGERDALLGVCSPMLKDMERRELVAEYELTWLANRIVHSDSP